MGVGAILQHVQAVLLGEIADVIHFARQPQECMGTMARTRGFMTFLACSRSNVAVRGLMSTNTGTQPKKRIVVMVPKNV